ncbi:MAG: ABC transporter substrate-binding protein [bacterium]|nr:ABC transporter substrate-binding protein [bacterium]
MKKYLTLIVSILIILFFACCYFIEVNKKNNNELRKITVAEVTHSLFYSPFYSAIANGYFEDEGIEIDLLLTPGADSVMASVLSGDADIGLSGSEATIYIYNSGEKDYIKTFAQLTQKDGSFIVSRTNIENFTLNDLKGKYIIGGRIGGMPEMTLEYALKENGINPKKDLTIDTSISFSSMASSFIGGIGDFVALFEPQATKIVNEGYGYIVASLGEIGGVVPYTAFNAKISFIEENKDLIDGFTKAIQKGLDYVHENESNVIAENILSFFPDTSLNDLTSAIERYKQNDTWPSTTTFTKESFDHLQDIVIEAGFLEKKVDYNDLIYVK